MIEKINFDFRKAEEQTDLFTPYHVKYDCFIGYNNKEISIPYQCNPKYITVKKEGVLDCVLSDIRAIAEGDDWADFLYEFGYTDSPEAMRKGIKAYDGILIENLRMHNLFTDEEIFELEEELEDYI